MDKDKNSNGIIVNDKRTGIYNDESTLHDGHRTRVWDRLINMPEEIKDHELLELVLYNIIPRVDTSPLAHKLLRKFSTLGNVLSATAEELVRVDGVTTQIARYLILYGEIQYRLYERRGNDFLDIKKECQEFVDDTRRYRIEFVSFIVTKPGGKIVYRQLFTQNKPFEVSFPIDNLLKTMDGKTKNEVFIVHNHPTGQRDPSKADFYMFAKISALSALCNFVVKDLCIATSESWTSLKNEGMLSQMNDYVMTELERESNKIFLYPEQTDKDSADYENYVPRHEDILINNKQDINGEEDYEF